MKGDTEALFESLDRMLRDCDSSGADNMRNFKVVLNYNEMCAAHFALRKLIAERNKERND